jgi:photosystem II stability/assembly factor-like uncharacterized protein
MPRLRLLVLTSLAFILPLTLFGQEQSAANQFSGMKWRLLGPFRGGRVTAVAGVAADPTTYYFATPGGGIWKSTNGGRVWFPISDSVKVPSIGSLTVAASASNVIYAGTGEQTRGKGVYRSSDSGKTWNSAGLQDVPYIQAIIVDPQNPDVAVAGGNSIGFGILWHPIPKSAYVDNRGVFRTEDGGKTWKKVYVNDETFGVVDMCSDPGDPRTLYAVMYRPDSGSGDKAIPATSDIVKSSDGGVTWAPMTTKGLPDKGRGRMGIGVAPRTKGQRLYAILGQGFYRSDDGGANWYQSTKDTRVLGSPYFSRVFPDTHNPDLLYVAQTSLYRSSDGGKTFEAYVGAPSGDDFHVLWIDPENSARMLLGVDQGAIVSVDAGKSWTSWYNQPTGQFYHVSTDNLFPYRVFGAQQDSGTAAILSRSDYGQILLQDWFSIGGFEYAFIEPDPAHPDYVFSGGWYGSVIRYDKSTGEIATVFERGNKYRFSSMAPLAFSPQDPSVLYQGTQYVLKTTDGGKSWHEISADLTGYKEEAEPKEQPQEQPKEEPKEIKKDEPKQEQNGKEEQEKKEQEENANREKPRPTAITALAPSPVKAGQIWAGTGDRIVQLTRDEGKTWQNVTPPGLAEPGEILYVEASHHDAATAYLTIGGTRESTPPNVLRTHDYGKSWQKIVAGFPADEMVRVVREDPKRKGLLYAGTDSTVFVSWDDGDHWQPLTLNLPPTPITDLKVHGDDLAISTFGRSMWILDDVTPLREMTPKIAASDVHLFTPQSAIRVRWDNYEDTPFPVETPAGENPPDGAILSYYLKNAATNALTLTIYDDQGTEVAKYTSNPKVVQLPPANVPDYWFAPPTALTKAAGVNRFAWDLRYPPPPTLPYGYYGNLLDYMEYTLADHAIAGLTPREQPRGPLVVPGKYTAELAYNGKTYKQPLTIVPDPRIHATQADLVEQRDVALLASRGMKSSFDAFHQIDDLRKALDDRQKAMAGADAEKAKPVTDALSKKLDAVEKGTRSAPGIGPVNRDLARLIFSVESADLRPADTVKAAVEQNCDTLDKNLAQWQQVNQQDVTTFNGFLAAAKMAALPVATVNMSGCKP